MADEKRSVGVRVRPNSQDFIRLLRAELKGKQATFWVDVRAKTTQATGDVRKWAATDLKQITGFVRVRANTGEASRDVAEWRRRQATTKTIVNVGADTSQATRQIAQLQAMARDITVRVKADTSGGRSAVERAARSSVKNTPLSEASDNKRRVAKSLDEFAAQVNIGGERMAKAMADNLQKALKGKKVQVDADTSPAQKSFRELLAQFGGEQVEVEVDADTTKAETRTAELKRNLELRNVKLEADINLRRARTALAELRLKEKLNKIELDVDVKKNKAEAFFKNLQGIEKRFGNLTVLRSLDLGPLTLGKPTGLIGTLTTITALAGAVPGAVAALSALSDTIVRLSGAAALAPGAIGALAASMATLSVGTIGVSDTFSAMFDMWTEGTSKTNAYRNSVEEEAKAQRGVATARRDALGELRDLNNELRGGVLNEAQALLDVQKARDRYAQGGFSNETERLQGLLDIRKAELNVDEVREKNLRTQQKVNEANTKGVEGSDKVQDALAGLAQAQNNGTAAQSKFNDALEQLSPNAQDFVKTIAGMKGELFDFKNSIQDTIFNGAGSAFSNMFDKLAPVVEPGMERIAQGLNRNLLQVFDTVSSPDGQSIIQRILGGTADVQQSIATLIDPLTKGIGTLVAAGTEHLPQVIDLFTNLADRFERFIKQADEDGSLDTFLSDGVTALKDMAETGINLVKIINDLSKAFGGNLIGSLSDATGKLHEYLASAEGQAKINELMDKAKDIWNDWAPVLEKLPGVFSSVADAAKDLLDTIMPIIEGITGFMKENPGLVSAFITGWLGAKVLTGVFSPLITVFKGAIALGGTLFKLLEKIPGAATALKGAFDFAKGVLPGGPGILTTPGPVGGAGSAAGTGLAATATAAVPFVAVTGGFLAAAQAIYDASPEEDKRVAGTNITTDDLANARTGGRGTSANRDRNASRQVARVMGPNGEPPKPGTPEYDLLVKWVKDGKFKDKFPNFGVNSDNRIIDTTTNQIVPGFLGGGYHSGYTPWGAKQGKMAELHGGEYVEPKHVVDHYGMGAMQAIHEKRVPKQFLGSFDGGGPTNMVWDPNTGQFVPIGSPMSHLQNPTAGSPGIIDSLATGAAGIGSAFGNAATAMPGATGVGPLPGPLPGAPAIQGGFGGGFGNSFLGGLGIPGLGGQQSAQTGPGWGPGGPPIGLGGGPLGPNGEAPFDMRKFGIGPGPLGSGPNDWMKFTGETLGKFGSSFITTLAGGLLDSVGLSGVSSYIQDAGKIAGNFFPDPSKSGVQDPSAGMTNDQVNALLGVYGGIPGNPAYPGYGMMPGAFDPATGTALPGGGGNGGLQINTLRGKAAIQSRFPWATNIGGVRADNLKWHPQGLALDVMTDPGHGNNDPASPEGLAKGNALYAWLTANKQALGIDYLLWQEKDHYNHIHVNFAASGYPAGGGPADVGTPTGLTPAPNVRPGAWGSAPAGAAPPGGPPISAGQEKYMRDRWNNASPEQRKYLLDAGLYSPDGTPTPSRPAPKPAPRPTKPASPWAPPKKPAGGIGVQYGPPTMELGRDTGGFLPVGTSIVHNYTGKPEVVLNGSQAQYVGSFLPGGAIPTGAIIPPPKPWKPPPAQITPMKPITPTPRPTPPPKPTVPPVIPQAPPIATPPTPAAPAEPGISQGPALSPYAPSDRPATGVGPGESGDHVHPALRKGITSGFATAGNLAATAISLGSAAATGGIGGGGGGGLGGMVSGLFQQAGKIANNVANVASSFLVGNITGGTTANPYGVTQRGSVPTGGTKVIDASSNQYGDVYTNDLDSYFTRVDRRNAQQAQSNLGRWGNA